MVDIIFHKEPERIGGGITEITCEANGKTSHLFIDMGADMDKGIIKVSQKRILQKSYPNPTIFGRIWIAFLQSERRKYGEEKEDMERN